LLNTNRKPIASLTVHTTSGYFADCMLSGCLATLLTACIDGIYNRS
jgi:hypothetical protein